MNAIKGVNCQPVLAKALLMGAILMAALSASGVTILPGGLNATKSGNDLILSFPTTSPNLYTVQISPDLLQPWTNFQGTQGDGTVKTITISNVIFGSKGFYRLLSQQPASLVLPPSTA